MKINSLKKPIAISLMVIAAAATILTACNLTPPTAPTQAPQTDTPASPPVDNQSDSDKAPANSTTLPSALYLLGKDGGEIFQIWRISQDGTTTKLTAEPLNVDEFAVNPVTGQVAYITNNQIYLMNADTTGRNLLVDGSGANQSQDSFFYLEKISGLTWSVNGTQLAYGQNGLNLFIVADNTSQKIIENELEEIEGGHTFPKAIYRPLNWSPDGSLLLVDIGFYEAGTIGVFNPARNEIIRLGEGIVCCHPTWSADSRSVIVGSPFFGMIQSGLWRYDASTGAETELIPTTSADNTLNYAGWPLALPDGNLRFFYGTTTDFPSGDVPLVMVQTGPDGISGLTHLRSEEWLNYEVLWAPDGQLAVTIQPVPGVQPGWPRTGPAVLVPASSEEASIPLGLNGYQLQWGP